jgi:carbonic anhydrase
MSTKAILERETPDSALQKLLDGNNRFRNHQHTVRDFMQEMVDTKEEQFPFAIILGCIDSRVPVEILFDQGIGDLFVTRVAGNIVNKDIIGGMEFACKVVGSKVIMVLGHENCGAVKAACDDINIGYITDIVKKIKPSIQNSELIVPLNSSNEEHINKIARTNVNLTIDSIREKSKVLRNLEQLGMIKIVGAYYHIHSGEVEIL